MLGSNPKKHSSVLSMTTAEQIEAVLADAWIIHAHTTNFGPRVVTLEKSTPQYETDKHDRKLVSQVIVGKGVSVEAALKQALVVFYFGKRPAKKKADQHLYSEIPFESKSIVDKWLMEHRGTLRAFKDEDRQIVCVFAGLMDPNSSVPEPVNFHGTGHNFLLALQNAFAPSGPIRTQATQHVTHITVQS